MSVNRSRRGGRVSDSRLSVVNIIVNKDAIRSHSFDNLDLARARTLVVPSQQEMDSIAHA